MADAIAQLLIDLLQQLPPNMRPGIIEALNTGAVSQPYWTPFAVLVLGAVVIGLVHLTSLAASQRRTHA